MPSHPPPHVAVASRGMEVYWKGFMGGSLLTAALVMTTYLLFSMSVAGDSKRRESPDISMPVYNRSLNMLQVALHRLQSLRRSPNDGQIRPSEHIHSPPPSLAFLSEPSSSSSIHTIRGGPIKDEATPSRRTRWPQGQGREILRNSTAMHLRSHDLHTNHSSQWYSCRARYGTRSFLPPGRKRKPPMLYTFPGSGNTWCRLLIEYTTGIYTGSVYNDKTLLEALPGEFSCNHQVSAIKIHPHTHTFAQLRSTRFNSDAEKCSRGSIKSIDRAILLIRNPFDSIWSEYQRRVTQDHVGGVQRDSFDWARWQANAANLAHQYNLMWTVHHAGIDKEFPPSDVLYIRYEDLKDRSTRIEAMRRVASFLGLNDPSMEQLECAYLLADNRHTHRSTDAQSELMTKTEAYTRPLACRMWNLFGASAARYQYSIWGNYDCTNVTAVVPRVNVGPQGEYNYQWVKPGMPLLDFGEHAPSRLPPPDTKGGRKGVKYNPPSSSSPKKKPRPMNKSKPKPKLTPKPPPKHHTSDASKKMVDNVSPEGWLLSPDGDKQTITRPQLQPVVTPPAEVAVATAIDNNNPKRPQGGGLASLTGMSLEQAMSAGAVIAEVGKDKPAWAA